MSAFRLICIITHLFITTKHVEPWTTCPPFLRHKHYFTHSATLTKLQAETGSNKNNQAENTEAETAQSLLQKAQRIREEVSTFENEKLQQAQATEQALQEEAAAKQEVRLNYSAELPILKPNGETVVERVDFKPLLAPDTSTIITIEAPLPLGMILSQDQNQPSNQNQTIPLTTLVEEVTPESNAQRCNVQQGDLLRCVSACHLGMEGPTWQLLVGGIGQPVTKRFMYQVDGRPLEEVLEAVGSNRMDPEGRPVVLVLERRKS